MKGKVTHKRVVIFVRDRHQATACGRFRHPGNYVLISHKWSDVNCKHCLKHYAFRDGK